MNQSRSQRLAIQAQDNGKQDRILAQSLVEEIDDGKYGAKTPEMTISRRSVGILGLLLVASWLITLLARGAVSTAVFLFSEKIPAHPYFLPEYAGLLYVLLPIVVLCSLLTYFLPGLYLALATGRSQQWTDLTIRAFTASFVGYAIVTSAVKAMLATPVQPGVFMAVIAGSSALSWAFLAYRVYRGAKLQWPLSERRDLRRLIWSLVIPTITLLALLPVFLWQDMHDDGIEALELGRSLFQYILPRFPTPSGILGIGAGMQPMAFPVHWFITLFGPVEFSARIPILLYLPVLYALLIQLIEIHTPRKLGLAEEAVLVLGVATFVVTMAYNASYDPYFADVAAPAAFETLTIVCILATIYFLWTGVDSLFFLFAVLSYLARPTGLLVLGALGLATFAVMRHGHWSWLLRLSVAVALCFLVSYLYNGVFLPSVVTISNPGIPFGNMLMRYQHLTVDDFSRIKYALFPSGILPLFAFLLFRRHDPFAKAIIIVSVVYFAFFYLPAFVALHHFVPLMVLPWIVFWRFYLRQRDSFRRLGLPALAITTVGALWLSLPRHFDINRMVRSIGERTAYLVGDYDTDYRTVAKHSDLLKQLIFPDWDVSDPTRELVSSPNTIIYYAQLPKAADTTINYVVQYLDEPIPPGFTRVAEDEIAALYVKDFQQWNSDRFRTLRTDFESRLYDIPRATLFRHWGARQGHYTIDLLPYACRASLLESFVEAYLAQYCALIEES